MRDAHRTQLLVLLGVSALTFIIACWDGISGLVQAVQNVHAEQSLVMVRTRWYMTFGLPLISVAALVMAGVAHYRQQLFDLETFVVGGAVLVGAVIALGVGALVGFSSWIETRGYERCTSLDHVQGVTRYGTRSVEVSAWTPVGQCR